MVEIISVHIPKTAGSTFRRVIGQIYKPEEIFDCSMSKHHDESKRQASASDPKIKAIHGHFHGDLFDTQFPNAKKVAWVRHPIVRIISHYYYLKSLPEATELDIEVMSLLDFAEHSKNLISKYINNLDSYLFVGIQEFFQEDLDELKLILGWGKTHINNENQNKFTGYHEYCHNILSDDQIVNQIASYNQEDLDLYEYLLNTRAKRNNSLSSLNLLCISWQKAEIELKQFAQKKIVTEEDLNYCYRLLLGREPDREGKQTWLNRIKQEQISLDSIVFRFLESQEFRKIYFDNSYKPQIDLNEKNFEEYAKYCYKLLINRTPKDELVIKRWKKLVAEQKINMISLVRESIDLSDYSVV
jgi:hypothetical protein